MAIEFQILMGPEARKIDPEGVPWPDSATVFFAMEDGQPVGRSSIVSLPHIEGTWVEEAHRGSTIAPRLISKIESTLAKAGAGKVFAFIVKSQPEVAGYMERFGYSLEPFMVYSKELK